MRSHNTRPDGPYMVGGAEPEEGTVEFQRCETAQRADMICPWEDIKCFADHVSHSNLHRPYTTYESGGGGARSRGGGVI